MSEDCNDYLSIKETNEKDAAYFEILKGKFTSIAWNNYVLFVLMDNTYYSFDIKAYTPPEPITDPEYNQNTTPEYALNKYTPSEFLNLYPNYFSYNWYYHNTD